MSKSLIGKLVTGLFGIAGFGLMIANNLFRAFDFIPYGSLVAFFAYFAVWAPVYLIMSRYGYFDWWNKSD